MHDFLNSQELQIFKFCHVPRVRLVRGLPLFVPPSRGDGGSTHGGSRSCCAVGSGTLSALLQLKLCPYFSCDFLGEPGIVKAQKFKVLGNVAILALGHVGCFSFYFDLTFTGGCIGKSSHVHPRISRTMEMWQVNLASAGLCRKLYEHT